MGMVRPVGADVKTVRAGVARRCGKALNGITLKAPKTPTMPERLLVAWFIVLIIGQLALALYVGREWVVVVWTIAWFGVAAVYDRRRFAR